MNCGNCVPYKITRLYLSYKQVHECAMEICYSDGMTQDKWP